MKTERVVTKNRDEASISRIIQSFIGLGWVYTGISEHGNGYILRFDWDKETPAVYPKSHQA
jgi:hypothetical protein